MRPVSSKGKRTLGFRQRAAMASHGRRPQDVGGAPRKCTHEPGTSQNRALQTHRSRKMHEQGNLCTSPPRDDQNATRDVVIEGNSVNLTDHDVIVFLWAIPSSYTYARVARQGARMDSQGKELKRSNTRLLLPSMCMPASPMRLRRASGQQPQTYCFGGAMLPCVGCLSGLVVRPSGGMAVAGSGRRGRFGDAAVGRRGGWAGGGGGTCCA